MLFLYTFHFIHNNVFLQFTNAAAMVGRGMGTIVHFEDISKDTIIEAIKFALRPETQENARKVSYSYRNRIRTPKQTAVWWVEHVAATGGAPLTKSRSENMPFYTYYSLDVYFAIIFGLTVTLYSLVWIFKRYRARRLRLSKVKSN